MPSHVRCVAGCENWETFAYKFALMHGIVESFVDGRVKRSPSVQCRIDPLGHPRVIATHDQLLGGHSGQVYLGCTFPAAPAYCADPSVDTSNPATDRHRKTGHHASELRLVSGMR